MRLPNFCAMAAGARRDVFQAGCQASALAAAWSAREHAKRSRGVPARDRARSSAVSRKMLRQGSLEPPAFPAGRVIYFLFGVTGGENSLVTRACFADREA